MYILDSHKPTRQLIGQALGLLYYCFKYSEQVLTRQILTRRFVNVAVQANCTDNIVAPPLSMNKWSLSDQDNMSDCAVGLPQCPTPFNHLHIASGNKSLLSNIEFALLVTK